MQNNIVQPGMGKIALIGKSDFASMTINIKSFATFLIQMQSGYANNILLCRILVYFTYPNACFPVEFVFNFI